MKKLSLVAAALFSNALFAVDLPANLEWQTNWDAPKIGSPEAKQGGVLHSYMQSFPQTFRIVGPDSNTGFRSYFLDEIPQLVVRHPDTLEWIPSLANEWAFGDDNKTVYFKLSPNVRWSDGKKVTADDYVFALNFYRSKDIVAPWYNDFWTNIIKNVEKIDDYTIKVTTVNEMDHDDMLDTITYSPIPEHFYRKLGHDKNGDGIPDDYIRRMNFRAAPTVAPYELDEVKKGQSITFKKVKNWWGYSNPYYANRYNVDKEKFLVIRDNDIAFKHFEKGDLDVFGALLPSYWHDKLPKSAVVQKGYVDLFWGYNQYPTGAGGIWFNTQNPLLANINIRKGLTYAIDYDGMIQHVLKGDYVRKPNPLGYGHGQYDNPNIQPPKFDPALAVEYFKKAGFDKVNGDGYRVNAKGEVLSFPITYGWNTHTPRLAYIKEQARKAGVNIILNLVDGSSAFKKISDKNFDLAWLNMGGGLKPQYWEYFHSSNKKGDTNNFNMYSTPELDKLIMQYRQTFDVAEKQRLSREIQQIVHDAYLIVPGYMVPYSRLAYWRWVKFPAQPMQKLTDSLLGGVYAGQGVFWIDQNVRKETLKAMKTGKTFKPVIIMDTKYKPKGQ